MSDFPPAPAVGRKKAAVSGSGKGETRDEPGQASGARGGAAAVDPAPDGRGERGASQPLYLISQEYHEANGKSWVRHRYDAFNKEDYPAGMFTAAPSLPPCGSNTKASRSWVDFFDGRTKKRLYGFCALDLRSEHSGVFGGCA